MVTSRLGDWPRILLCLIGLILCLLTLSSAISHAPLLLFLIGSVFLLVGLNGIKLSNLKVSPEGIDMKYITATDTISPITEEMIANTNGHEESADYSKVLLNKEIKESLAGIITNKTGVLTGESEIETVRARDKDNLFVYTAGGKGFIMDFPTQASVVGIK